MNAPTRQGTVVVERDGKAFLVMFPNGAVQGFATKRAVEKAVARWFKEDLLSKDGAVGIGQIEWPAGTELIEEIL